MVICSGFLPVHLVLRYMRIHRVWDQKWMWSHGTTVSARRTERDYEKSERLHVDLRWEFHNWIQLLESLRHFTSVTATFHPGLSVLSRIFLLSRTPPLSSFSLSRIPGLNVRDCHLPFGIVFPVPHFCPFPHTFSFFPFIFPHSGTLPPGLPCPPPGLFIPLWIFFTFLTPFLFFPSSFSALRDFYLFQSSSTPLFLGFVTDYYGEASFIFIFLFLIQF